VSEAETVGDAPAPTAPQRTAAGRMLSLIGAFEYGGGVLTLSELSRHGGLSLTTTHRLVRELMEWGGLEVDHRGRYRLSRKFVQLTSSTDAMHLREIALPHLMKLHRQVGGSTVHLAVRDGRNIMYLDALRSYPNYTGESRIGGNLPLHATAAGLVLLANSTEDEIREYMQEPLQRFTPHTIVDPDELTQTLEMIRAQRHFVYPRSIVLDAGGVATPITGLGGAVRASVNVVWFIDQQDPQTLLGYARAATAAISRALVGGRQAPDARTVDFNRRRAGLF